MRLSGSQAANVSIPSIADISNASQIAPMRIVCRLCLVAFLGTGLAMMWLWDTMTRQSCATYPQAVFWKGIRVCASASQAQLWRLGTVALVTLAIATIATSLLIKMKRAQF